MTSSPESDSPRATRAVVRGEALVVSLADGRTVSVPLAWFPRLMHGTAAERKRCRLLGAGEGIHWPDLDEDVSVEGLLLGRPSRETAESLRAWIASRSRAA